MDVKAKVFLAHKAWNNSYMYVIISLHQSLYASK